MKFCFSRKFINFKILKETLDYIAYVAKDITEWRACYVIECGNEMAQSIITAMGHAFELRYREYYGAEK